MAFASLPAITTRVAVTMIALLLSLAQRVLPSDLPRSSVYQPPAVMMHSSHTISEDLSAAVRIHRDGGTMVVLAATPLSEYWETLHFIDAPPLVEQYEAAGFRVGEERPPARIEPLRPSRFLHAAALRPHGVRLARC